jgi:hypothetical protein
MLIRYNGKLVTLNGQLIQVGDDTVNDYVEDDYVSNYFELTDDNEMPLENE